MSGSGASAGEYNDRAEVRRDEDDDFGEGLVEVSSVLSSSSTSQRRSWKGSPGNSVHGGRGRIAIADDVAVSEVSRSDFRGRLRGLGAISAGTGGSTGRSALDDCPTEAGELAFRFDDGALSSISDESKTLNY